MGAQGVHPSTGCRDVFCKARTNTGAWLSQRSTEIHGMILIGGENLTASGFRVFYSTGLPHAPTKLLIPALKSITFSLLLAGMPTRNTKGTPTKSTMFNPQQPRPYLNPHLHKPHPVGAFPTRRCCNTMAPNTGCYHPATHSS